LELIVGAVSGFVGALFLLLLERADRFRDALIVWAHSKAFVGFLVVSAASGSRPSTADSRRTCVTNSSKPLPSSIPRQLPLSPMMGLAIRIELANLVAVQRLHDADPRQHHWAAFCLAGFALAAGTAGAAVGSRGLNACVSHSSIMTDSREPLPVSLSKKTE
jgi:hypothetical protein